MIMEMRLNVNKTTCIKCGRCSKVCPALIFVQPEVNAEIEIHNINNCIKCGHCVGMCPTGSVEHSLFPADKVHRIDRNALPSPEQMMLLIKSRRSNRAFSKKEVPSELMDKILEAAHSAPTASNSQNLSYIVVTDPEKLHRISELTIKGLLAKVSTMNNGVGKAILKKLSPNIYRYMGMMKIMKQRFDSGTYDPILRGATAVIFIQAPKGRFAITNANLSYQNGSLMAESLGVSQFYTGFVCTVINQSKEMHALLGIEGNVYAGMALGMPEFKFTNYIDKQDIRVTKI